MNTKASCGRKLLTTRTLFIKMKRFDFKRYAHIWVPILLVIYLVGMAYIGRDTLIVQKEYFRYFGTITAELIVILALSFFLHKKFMLKKQREERL